MFRLIFSFLFLTGLFTISLTAQQLEITNDQVTYKKEDRASVRVLLDPEPKTVKKAFEDWLKDHYDVNLKGIGFLANKDVLKAEEVEFPEISENELDFFAKVVREKDVTTMHVFASLGYEIHISPEKYPTEYASMKSIVQSFLNDWLPVYYKDRVSYTSERLEALRVDREDLQETIAGNEKKMEDLKKENEKLRKKLSNGEDELNGLTQSLQNREKELKTINDKLKGIK